MSDSKEDGLIESVKKTLMDRINTPLFGFIFLSWVVFNWDNILFVMFSEVSIEKRINAVKVSSDFYFRGFLCPITSGFLLSVAFPYLQWSVSFLQRKAQRLLDSNSEKRELAEYAAIKSLATQRAEANNAVAFAEAAAALTAAEKNKQAAQTESDAESIREAYKTVQDNVTKATNELSGILSNIENQKEKESFLKAKIGDLESKISQAQNKLEALGDVDELKKEVSKYLVVMSVVVDNLKRDALDIKTEAISKSISKGGLSTQVSFDGMDFLEFTNSMNTNVSKLEDGITEIRSLLDDEISF
ncbi:hypothetical protein [Serratia plymuthica]|uniref:hypothetical protein n=1 Tax=Serratia plymuthica TaxID=82996 RepID=UPI0018D709FB|nr:hypothetical protein [Serratia plymuthica]QPS58141.1 hypothetical protein I6G53_11830 [Serratia plymuthica]CAI1919169.1 Uncharacterised protein [Serratia plymuthica]